MARAYTERHVLHGFKPKGRVVNGNDVEEQVRSYTNVQTWCVQGQQPRQALCVFTTANIQSSALIIWQGETPSTLTFCSWQPSPWRRWSTYNTCEGFTLNVLCKLSPEYISSSSYNHSLQHVPRNNKKLDYRLHIQLFTGTRHMAIIEALVKNLAHPGMHIEKTETSVLHSPKGVWLDHMVWTLTWITLFVICYTTSVIIPSSPPCKRSLKKLEFYLLPMTGAHFAYTHIHTPMSDV